MPPKLVALDLDGTLLKADGAIDPRDVAAVGRALRLGVAITLATGRLATGALPCARALGLVAPLVCADGGLLACATTGATLEVTALAPAVVVRALATFEEHGVAPFLFFGGEIHAAPSSGAVHALLRSYTPHIIEHDCSALSCHRAADQVVLAVGVGARGRAESARRALEASAPCVEVATYVLSGETWAVRVRPAACDKARLLARLARRLGAGPADVCALGDWYNDVSMLSWAGRALAMADAPGEVRAAARGVVRARRGEGGAVAEAMARWLS